MLVVGVANIFNASLNKIVQQTPNLKYRTGEITFAELPSFDYFYCANWNTTTGICYFFRNTMIDHFQLVTVPNVICVLLIIFAERRIID